jgi:hypothetical protein
MNQQRLAKLGRVYCGELRQSISKAERSKIQSCSLKTIQATWNNKMINAFMVTLVIALLGIFAAGSCELAEERTERKRVEKWLKKKYSRTY